MPRWEGKAIGSRGWLERAAHRACTGQEGVSLRWALRVLPVGRGQPLMSFKQRR